jgi:RNA 2',3'-cyclic 3'-phosphodiesterase
MSAGARPRLPCVACSWMCPDPPPVACRRLFFACWPDQATRAAMVHAGRKAVRGSGGRPVPAGNLHATLAFLGSVPEGRLPAILAVGQSIRAAPLEFIFERIDFWPRPQVLVARSENPAGVEDLVAALWARLAALGLERDLRPFRSHVTLARKVRKPAADLTLQPVTWPVRELTLVESVTDPAGAHYRVLAQWPLIRPGAAAPGSPPEPPPPAHSPPG